MMVLAFSRTLRGEVVSLIARVMAVFLVIVELREGGRLDSYVSCLGWPS